MRPLAVLVSGRPMKSLGAAPRGTISAETGLSIPAHRTPPARRRPTPPSPAPVSAGPNRAGSHSSFFPFSWLPH